MIKVTVLFDGNDQQANDFCSHMARVGQMVEVESTVEAKWENLNSLEESIEKMVVDAPVIEEQIVKSPLPKGVYCAECGSKSRAFHKRGCKFYVDRSKK